MARDFLDSFVGQFRDYRTRHRLNESKAAITITFNSDRDRWEFISQLREEMDPVYFLDSKFPPFYARNTETVQGIAVTLAVADKGFY